MYTVYSHGQMQLKASFMLIGLILWLLEIHLWLLFLLEVTLFHGEVRNDESLLNNLVSNQNIGNCTNCVWIGVSINHLDEVDLKSELPMKLWCDDQTSTHITSLYWGLLSFYSWKVSIGASYYCEQKNYMQTPPKNSTVIE